MTVLLGAATIYGLFVFALVAIGLVLLGLVWCVWRWRRYRDVPRRGLAPQAWVRGPDGKPVPFDSCAETLREYDGRDAGDEAKDIATEGLGEQQTVYEQLQDGLKQRNPRLTRKQIGAIIMARCRTPRKAQS